MDSILPSNFFSNKSINCLTSDFFVVVPAFQVEIGAERQVRTEDLPVLLNEIEQEGLALLILGQLGALDIEEVGDLGGAGGQLRDLVLFLEVIVELVVGWRHCI